MYARYVQKGEAIDHMPETAVAAGDVVVVGNLIGIARLDIPAGVLGALAVVGVYDVAKAAGAVAVGTPLYWDAANKKATAVAAGNPYLGKATRAAGATDETVRVLLNAPYTATVAE